jgi:hypothetical protein
VAIRVSVPNLDCVDIYKIIYVNYNPTYFIKRVNLLNPKISILYLVCIEFMGYVKNCLSLYRMSGFELS